MRIKRRWFNGTLVVLSLILKTTIGHAAFSTHHDTIPDFAQNPTIQSVANGNWSSPSTWNLGRVPVSTDIVLVKHMVTYDSTTGDANVIGIAGGAALKFSTTISTKLRVGTLLVQPQGYLEVGTPANPISANLTAEIMIKNVPINTTTDPNEYGTGILDIDGKVVMHGAVKTPTFLRLATEPKKGNTTLSLESPVSGWTVGDHLVIPDTRYIQWNETSSSDSWKNATNQWEELTIQSISADGKTITLTAPLAYDHLGARDLNGVLDFLPHVGNLSRNVKVDSENPGGTRGHGLFTSRTDVDIRYVWFRDLGRTTYKPLGPGNHIGRYPLHLHHVMGPTTIPANGYQFTLLGNAIDGGSSETQFKWGIAIHNSHYGLIRDNVVYNYNGSSIATEDGSESYNIIDHNFAIRGIGEPNNSLGECRYAEGTEGVGFWFRGPNNYVTNNVAANFQNPSTECAYGFVYQFRMMDTYTTSKNIQQINIPNFPGADTSVTGQYTVKNGNNMPILENNNNEAYGAMQGGFTYWWVGGLDGQPYASAQESLVKNLKIWNTYNKTVYHYPANRVTFDNLVIRNNYNTNAHCCGHGFFTADYSGDNIVIRNSDIQGSNAGIVGPSSGALTTNPNITIQNTYLRNWTNISIQSAGSVNGCWMKPLWNKINNVTFAAPPGRSLRSFAMGSVDNATLCNSVPITTTVYSYQGNSSDNFQIYYNTAIPPRPSCSTTTRSEISSGLLCPIAPEPGGTVTAPTAPTGLAIN